MPRPIGTIYRETRGGGPTGRWVGEIRRDGFRHEMTHANRDVVKRQLNRWAAEARRTKSPAHVTDETVAEYLDRWLTVDGLGPRVSDRTWSDRRRIVDTHLVPSIGALKLCELSRQDVRRLIDELEGRGLRSSTVAKSKSVLSSALTDAWDRDLVATNVAAGVTVRRRAGEEGRSWAIDIDDETQRRIVDAALAEGRMAGALVALAITTACRIGELRALRWDAIDIVGSSIKVRAAISRDRDGCDVVARPKTTAGVRTITLSSWVAARLETWRQDAPARLGLVFPNTTGGAISYTELGRLWRRIRDAAGLADPSAIPDLDGQLLQLRQLRHVGISTMMRRGWTPSEIARIAGHADGGVTVLKRYAAASAESLPGRPGVALSGMSSPGARPFRCS